MLNKILCVTITMVIVMNKEVKNGIIVGVVVILSLVVVYFITAIVTGEINIGGKKDNTDSSVSDNSYDNMIMASTTFDKSEDEYMVIFYSEKNKTDNLDLIISSYKGDIKLYKVNTDEVINKFVLSEEENSDATNKDELKIKPPTLIIIKDKKITYYTSNEDEIVQKLGN